ncbi:hypothetical protein [Aeromicrobium sp.]|uniref:hypothetical protein n=1 Tax=Aeromicrobium sp. TaxID=1871063 RepID=UPI0040342A57
MIEPIPQHVLISTWCGDDAGNDRLSPNERLLGLDLAFTLQLDVREFLSSALKLPEVQAVRVEREMGGPKEIGDLHLEDLELLKSRFLLARPRADWRSACIGGVSAYRRTHPRLRRPLPITPPTFGLGAEGLALHGDLVLASDQESRSRTLTSRTRTPSPSSPTMVPPVAREYKPMAKWRGLAAFTRRPVECRCVSCEREWVVPAEIANDLADIQGLGARLQRGGNTLQNKGGQITPGGASRALSARIELTHSTARLENARERLRCTCGALRTEMRKAPK